MPLLHISWFASRTFAVFTISQPSMTGGYQCCGHLRYTSMWSAACCFLTNGVLNSSRRHVLRYCATTQRGCCLPLSLLTPQSFHTSAFRPNLSNLVEFPRPPSAPPSTLVWRYFAVSSSEGSVRTGILARSSTDKTRAPRIGLRNRPGASNHSRAFRMPTTAGRQSNIYPKQRQTHAQKFHAGFLRVLAVVRKLPVHSSMKGKRGVTGSPIQSVKGHF